MKKSLLVIAGLLLTTQVGMAKYSHPAKILSMYSYGGDNAVIQLNINIADTGCTKKNALVIPHYTTTNKGMYSSVLSALVANKTVNIGYKPGNCSNLWGTRSLNRMYSVIMRAR